MTRKSIDDLPCAYDPDPLLTENSRRRNTDPVHPGYCQALFGLGKFPCEGRVTGWYVIDLPKLQMRWKVCGRCANLLLARNYELCVVPAHLGELLT